jgi:16S rRNA (guanine966-N2)-methyltransferase
MNIIAGCARNLQLASPPDYEVRPTAGRARKALFDSLGDIAGKGVMDLCSGSGALALEAASRGAAWCAMVEKSPGHISCIRENCRRVTAAGASANLIIMEFDICHFERYCTRLPGVPDIIFADPPYDISAELFQKMMNDEKFISFCSQSTIIWEIPDAPGAMGGFINAPALEKMQFRRFGSTIFLQGKIK